MKSDITVIKKNSKNLSEKVYDSRFDNIPLIDLLYVLINKHKPPPNDFRSGKFIGCIGNKCFAHNNTKRNREHFCWRIY